MTSRVAIPEDLAAQVMFASDRTCCVCRLEKNKVQIHHIDGDRSNNSFENLAVICLHCHSEAHTAAPFVQNLTPELVRLYNASWRGLVRSRLLLPSTSTAVNELALEVLLEVSLYSHSWKISFMQLGGSILPQGAEGQFRDVWDLMLELWIPQYSPEAYDRFLPLFDEGVPNVVSLYDRVCQMFSDVLPTDFRTLLLRATRQLQTERIAYRFLTSPAIRNMSIDQVHPFFYERFVGTIRALREVARDAERRREALASTADVQ